MDNILDDLTFEDIQRANEELKISRTSDGNRDSVLVKHVYNEFRRGENTLRFAYVAFGEYERYDIRLWYDQGSKPGKGFSMTYEELIRLRNDLYNFYFGKVKFEMRARYNGDKVSAILYDRISLISEFTLKGKGWNKEVSVIDFGYGKKIDFRKWANDYTVCGRGISVAFDEAIAISKSMHGL